MKAGDKVSKLKELRVAKGLSQKQLAEQTGISLSLIQKFDRKAKNINKLAVASAIKLSDALECDVRDFVEE